MQVAPDYARATAIIKAFADSHESGSSDPTFKPDVVPDDGFPVFGIMGVVAFFWVVGMAAWSFFSLSENKEFETCLNDTIAVGVGSIFKGRLIGCAASWIGLISRPLSGETSGSNGHLI